jgi:hypothetical protein
MPQANFLAALQPTPSANPFADARPLTACDKCGAGYHDRRIHNGQSLIRECTRCRRFLGFPLWYGQEGPQA